MFLPFWMKNNQILVDEFSPSKITDFIQNLECQIYRITTTEELPDRIKTLKIYGSLQDQTALEFDGPYTRWVDDPNFDLEDLMFLV